MLSANVWFLKSSLLPNVSSPLDVGRDLPSGPILHGAGATSALRVCVCLGCGVQYLALSSNNGDDGFLAAEGVISGRRLFFKYDHKPELVERFMGAQRNRATYISKNHESVFSPDSLAYKVLSKLLDPSIAVTATPKLLYPWPPQDPVINIGSDTEEWKSSEQVWAANPNKDPLCVRLGQVKSVTQINATQSMSNSKRPWKFRNRYIA